MCTANRQIKLDVLANDAMISACECGGQLAGMASPELRQAYAIPNQFVRGKYLLVFDPLDSSSNTDVSVSVGTIFSVLKFNGEGSPTAESYLQAGRECKAGQTGVRERDFNMRWIASRVADVHRILMRGGVFMYPKDTKIPAESSQLRLLYEANPMAMLVTQAAGLASTGRKRIADVQPNDLHERIPVIMGSAAEVERMERYHADYDAGTDEEYVSPLFKEHSLYHD